MESLLAWAYHSESVVECRPFCAASWRFWDSEAGDASMRGDLPSLRCRLHASAVKEPGKLKDVDSGGQGGDVVTKGKSEVRGSRMMMIEGTLEGANDGGGQYLGRCRCCAWSPMGVDSRGLSVVYVALERALRTTRRSRCERERASKQLSSTGGSR